jgi:hypothetical protein
MTTIATSTKGNVGIRLVVDADAAYVESQFGNKLTANILRDIADDLDPRD